MRLDTAQSRAALLLSRVGPWCLVVLGFGLAVVGLHERGRLPGSMDPDRLFHLAFSLEGAARDLWVTRELPQFPDLGWDQFFVDKEFLFHLLLLALARVGGEGAILWGVAAVGAAVLWAPVLLAAEKKLFAAAVSLLLIGLNSMLQLRLSLLRPHVLAMLFFTVLVWAALRSKSTVAVGLLSAGYALAYHATYIPLGLGVAFLATHGARGFLARRLGFEMSSGELLKAQGLSIVAGVGVGTAINPYFPGNLIQTAQVLVVALRGNSLGSELHSSFGAEILALRTNEYASQYGVLLLAFLFALLGISHRIARSSSVSAYSVALAAAGAGLIGASLLTPRAFEFAGPTIAVLAFTVFKDHGGLARSLSLGAGGVLHLAVLSRVLLAAPSGFSAPPLSVMAPVLAPLPRDAPVKVYHCNWGVGPYLYYLRPNARLIDVLDPTFLLMANADKFRLRTLLNAGRAPNPIGFLKDVFEAEYVFCDSPELNRQLRGSAQAELLASDPTQTDFLFRIH